MRFGLRLWTAPHALGADGWVSAPAEERLEDLHLAFSRKDVRAVIAGIGGNHSSQLPPRIDWEMIRQNPKVFVGFSDITVLLLAVHHLTGLVTFYGPMLATPLGEYPAILEYTADYFERALFRPEPVGCIEPSQAWTEEFLDWNLQIDRTRARALRPNPGPRVLRPGRARGRLLGGCLESLQHLRGTPWWPDFRGAILFWELSEEVPSPARVDAMLITLENAGALRSIEGMLVEQPYGYLWRTSGRSRTWCCGIRIPTAIPYSQTSTSAVTPIPRTRSRSV